MQPKKKSKKQKSKKQKPICKCRWVGVAVSLNMHVGYMLLWQTATEAATKQRRGNKHFNIIKSFAMLAKVVPIKNNST